MCEHGFDCGSVTNSSPFVLPAIIRNSKMITLIKLINKNPKSTSKFLSKEMYKAFGEDNIFNYLNNLKKYGIIEMIIEGRQRFYRLK